MRYREAAKKLRKLGCEELARRSGGSHRAWHNPVTGAVSPLPDWGHKDLKIGTLRQVVRDLGLDWEEFKKV
jgi:predicted RNA binding protein YcfA (HicA-like mRNA interferase family)